MVMINASILDNIVLPSLDNLKKFGIIFPKSERRLAQQHIDALNIKCVSSQQFCTQLSGGNKQKVAFGKWMGTDSDIIVMDCPTRGIDIGVKTAMYDLMYQLKKQGKSIIMISEELSELIGMSDRILIMKDGVITKTIARSRDVTEYQIIDYMI